MATFTILFEGLICHIGPDEFTKTHAALIDDVDHTPRIEIFGFDLAQPQAIPHFEILGDGDTVTIGNMNYAETDPTFRALVPGLRSLVRDGGTIIGDVFAGVHVPRDNVSAYVLYPPNGSLSAPETFVEPTDFIFESDNTFVRKQCVARGALFVTELLDTNGFVDITITRNAVPRVIRVRDTATIKINNLSEGGEHFRLYQGLLDANEMARARVDTSGTICPFSSIQSGEQLFGVKQDVREKAVARDAAEGKVTVLAIPNPECSNSTWP